VSKIDQMTTTQNQMFHRNETAPAPQKGSTGIPDLSSEELRKCVSKLPILFSDDSNEGEFVGWGYYTGGKLPGDKNGYKNFVSKQFKNVGEALTNQWSEGGRKDGDEMHELERAWKSFTQDKRDHWEAFARGEAAEPKMSVEEWEDLTRERCLEEGAQECRQYYLDYLLGEMSQTSIDAVASDVRAKVLREKEEDESAASKQLAYMNKHKLGSVLSEAINAAVVAESDNPMVFIADLLYQKAGIWSMSQTNSTPAAQNSRRWTPEEWQEWEAEHSHWTLEDWDKWESEQGGHLTVVVKE